MSAGTTSGKSKYIPYTRGMGRSASRGMRELIFRHLLAKPGSRLFGGTAVMLAGSLELESLAPGVRAGAVSAIAAINSPKILRHRLLPTREIAEISDWQEKIGRLAPLSLARDVRALGGSPNWLLMFLDEVAKQCSDRPRLLVEWYPNLDLIVHGGIDFSPYRDHFRELMEGSNAETREAYSASEGFFAFADRDDGEGLRLVPDGNVFFEFVPADEIQNSNPTRHWLGDLETGVNYAVILSTAAGLWSYVLGDTVRFLTRDPPRLLVTGRISYVLSAFGEHLISSEISQAVSAAAKSIGVNIVDFTVAPEPEPKAGAGGRHAFVMEVDPADVNAHGEREFIRILDETLCDLNADYRELRRRDYNLRPPQIRFVRRGAMAAWMKSRRGIGGQHKMPRIISERELFSDLTEFVETYQPPDNRG